MKINTDEITNIIKQEVGKAFPDPEVAVEEMLMEDAGTQSPEEMIADLERIHASGKHLLSLIDEILDLSAILIDHRRR